MASDVLSAAKVWFSKGLTGLNNCIVKKIPGIGIKMKRYMVYNIK
jgi:hypothetical protein